MAKVSQDKTFKVTRSYRVHLNESDLTATKRMVTEATYLDSHIEPDLVDAVTRAADGGDLQGSMYLAQTKEHDDTTGLWHTEWRWYTGPDGACYGVVRFEVEETDYDYEAE